MDSPKGLLSAKGNKWVVCALAIEGDEEVAQVHQWNNPSVPVVVHHMWKMAEVLALVEEYLPRRHWGKMWIHASNSCKLAAAANMLKRDLEAARGRYALGHLCDATNAAGGVDVGERSGAAPVIQRQVCNVLYL